MAHIVVSTRQEWHRFVRHFMEMVAAMIVGMILLGGLVNVFCALSDHRSLLEHPGTSAPIMATNMAIAMVAWMKHRGHAWPTTIEMAAAMYAPLVLFTVPYAMGAISGGAFLALTHILMLPAMWIAMLHRRQEYVGDHVGTHELS